MKRLAALAALALLAGCDMHDAYDMEEYGHVTLHKNHVERSRDTLYVSHDDTRNVTCWSFGSYSISCMPDWMLVTQNIPLPSSALETPKPSTSDHL